MITASLGRVKMEEIAEIPEEGTHATARLVTLVPTACVNIIAIMYSFKIRFHCVLNMFI